MGSSGMNLATSLAGLCFLAHTGLSTLNLKGLSESVEDELQQEIADAAHDFGIESAEEELLDLLTAGDEPFDPLPSEDEDELPSMGLKSPSWKANMDEDDDTTFDEISEPEPEAPKWEQKPPKPENDLPLNVPLKSIEEIKSMLPIKSIEEIKSMTPIKSIERNKEHDKK
eukprot:TRINITY_DN217_c0_g1_i12.p1 TRINITY_DN217_c0_g1~~TRINITY_DN217_c0_g1_i12.p1  ORF type:complete len:170 (-),score=51.04 TRINITY_DN217_c0_g1_i12:929-1438(-)